MSILFSRSRIVISMLCLIVCLGFASRSLGQTPIDINNTTAGAGGVYIDTDGMIRSRQLDAKGELAAMRDRVRNSAQAAKTEKLAFVSLPATIARAQALLDAGKPLPAELKYLGGITQVRYVFVYPETHDLVIAGPAEAIVDADSMEPVGKVTGRPVLHLDDFIVALRTQNAVHAAAGQAFGCSIDLPADALQRSNEVMQKYANASLDERVAQMAKIMGPQTVSVFGTEADTRFAFVCVAADYKLKRVCMGEDSLSAVGLGNAVDNSRAAGDRFWFEGNYQPLLVSADDNAFEIRGSRLQLKAGMLNFDTRGSTEKAKRFTKDFTDKMPAIATAVPLFADLQNIADMSLLAALIQHDKLDAKIGWTTSKLLDPKTFPVATVPVPKSADTLSAYHGGSIVAGGVMLTTDTWIDADHRQTDDKGELTPVRDQAAKETAVSDATAK